MAHHIHIRVGKAKQRVSSEELSKLQAKFDKLEQLIEKHEDEGVTVMPAQRKFLVELTQLIDKLKRKNG